MNYLLTLRFDGSAFHGSQRQSTDITVQEETERALSTFLRERITVYPCSRTDAGVHAEMFCCNFFTGALFDGRRLLRGFNALVPPSLAAYDVRQVGDSFNARKDALAKTYTYRIWNAEQRNPFYEKTAFHFPRRLDEDFLAEIARDFLGEHDFAAFCASGSSVRSTVRTVYSFDVRREGDLVLFIVTGNGFLYNMVRIMTGTLLDISDGKLPADSIPLLLDGRSRLLAGQTAPACGLFLSKVYYPEDI